MMGQALEMKSNIENRRSTNEFGTIIWQLGEIWPTGGWGSLEYATPEKGQVLGGRWKPLHYFLRNALFRDVIATCGVDARCYVKNDGVTAFSGTTNVYAINLASGKQSLVYSHADSVPAGSGSMSWFCLDGTTGPTCTPYTTLLSKIGCTLATCVLQISVLSSDNSITYSHHVHALLPPKNLTLAKTSVTFTVAPNTQGGASVTLSVTGGVALYTILTTAAYGRFSDNVLLLLPGNTVVDFIPFGQFSVSQLSSTLRVEYVQTYL